MRIWHEKLIPKLCQKHLCAMWREGLGCYKIIRRNKISSDILSSRKKPYGNHPATIEFEKGAWVLYERLEKVRNEMLKRGYHPKRMPTSPAVGIWWMQHKNWQKLKQQIEILKGKGCKCKV